MFIFELFETYIEDLLAFKAEVEKCCKFISKMRGKKANGPAILEEFSAQLEQEFPDVFAPAMEVEEAPMASKKRGRPSLESSASLESPERQPKKKAAKHEEDKHHIESGLSAAEKVSCCWKIYHPFILMFLPLFFLCTDCTEVYHRKAVKSPRSRVLSLPSRRQVSWLPVSKLGCHSLLFTMLLAPPQRLP